eukprot:TRINITY_DN26062_c0_g1_i1.p1 TRINITY_DN26062_c0_g1~~TRINITY_DN26062_c0_g1_i1.p1  ORF type:complete len:215 (-),score=54.21 TRINITY_DN26062_c0_g1_i1:78-722(-)
MAQEEALQHSTPARRRAAGASCRRPLLALSAVLVPGLWAGQVRPDPSAFAAVQAQHRQRRLAACRAGLGDLMGAMPKMMEGMKKLPVLQQKLRETPSEGTALGGRIKVQISGDLAPLAVEIDEGLMTEGLPAQVLADGVLVAMREAHNKSTELTRSELANFYKEMGMPAPGTGGAGGLPGMPGAGAAAPAVPAPPPPPSLDFDPAGIGSIRAVD